MRISDWIQRVPSDLTGIVSHRRDGTRLRDAVGDVLRRQHVGRRHWHRTDPHSGEHREIPFGAAGEHNENVITLADTRSEERRVGEECVSTGSSWWSPYP